MIDPRTVMEYAGHANLETTLRYLRPAAAQERIAAVSEIKGYSSKCVVRQLGGRLSPFGARYTNLSFDQPRPDAWLRRTDHDPEDPMRDRRN